MRRVILLSVVAVLASPSAAGAKEVGSLTLCGTNGCQAAGRRRIRYG
jgi:hypothetical protein